MGQLITINDSNYLQHVDPVGPDGQRLRKGLWRRNLNTHPMGCLQGVEAFDLPLIDEAEWDNRAHDQEGLKSSLQHVRETGNAGQRMPSLDQNGQGYCWAYSTTRAVELLRAYAGLPYRRLSGHMIGCLVKGYRDQGGWGGESVEFAAANGIADVAHWQEKSMSRSNDTQEMRTNAAEHKMIRWLECSGDASLRRKQVATALLLNFPVVGDFDFWSHSVCLIRLMSKSKTRLNNSWTDEWSDNGVGDLEGGKAWPDGAWVAALATASPV